MKKLSSLAILCFICIISVISNTWTADAQVASPNASIDTDILALRNTAIPDFSWHYDDYLQYAPAGLMLALKACGYESRSSWGRMLTSDAFSAASMAVMVNGIKYSVKRLRPDGSARNSFPSGHTATAFMTAAMLDKEYGWRSPWFSIGGYTAAALTGVSRIMNNRHWMSDVVAGAAVGIGAVHLGYFITDCIFKDKGLSSGFQEERFIYDASQKHYVAELLFGRRFIIGAEGQKEMGILPERGSLAGISADIPVIAGTGITARASASSMIYSTGVASDLYSTIVGGYWNFHFARRLEFQAKAMAGCAWFQGGCGADLACGVGLSLIIDSNFKLKGFADFESISVSNTRPWINSLVVGYSAAWFW